MQLIVLKKVDVGNVIEWLYNHFKGESARKLDKRVKKYFVGLSRNDIQKWINANEKHSKEKPIFFQQSSIEANNIKIGLRQESNRLGGHFKTSSGNQRKDIQVHFICDGRVLEIHLA